MLSSGKKSSRIVYHFSISYNNPIFIFWQLKIKASGDFFHSCCSEKFVLLEGIPIEKGVLKCHQIKSGFIPPTLKTKYETPKEFDKNRPYKEVAI